jgi:hypothetical protein
LTFPNLSIFAGYDATRARADLGPFDFPSNIPKSLGVLDQSSQLLGLHTKLRNALTPRDEFIFVAERLMQILIEKAMDSVDYECLEIETPNGDRLALLDEFTS